MVTEYQRPKEQLSQLFGSYKAEWLKEQLFDLFTKPTYFPELENAGPCILVGGRGTGKTTVLRSLSYKGQYALRGKETTKIEDFPYYGLYYRVNTNRVTAFNGPELPETEWIALFAHYFNLILCELSVKFLIWHQSHSSEPIDFSPEIFTRVALSLNLSSSPNSLSDFANNLDESKIRFEAYINNVVDGNRPHLSMQGAPIDTLFSALHHIPQFRNKNFFFLIDEYENFEPYQQRVVNTLIKHSGELYTFKIGVRELGIKEKTTLNADEQLISPSDYVKISIAEKLEIETFKNFALAVCNERIKRVKTQDKIIRDVRELLPNLNADEEADLLGINEKVKETKSKLSNILNRDEYATVDQLTPLRVYFLNFWAASQDMSLQDAFIEFQKDTRTWEERFQNNKHALLYTIKIGKSGIYKYYAGWDVFIRLAGSNIRYLLELVDQSLILHLGEEKSLSKSVSYETQTHAAQDIGKKNLSELEGLSVFGAQLTKLLLSLGRIFQVMAKDTSRHASEVNQFRISDQSLAPAVEDLLRYSVMHLALLRFPGNKLANETDTREYDYMVHPIFSAFFVFSYRRKRKMALSGRQLLGLVKEPKKAIKEVLAKTNRDLDGEQPLPEQMRLFEGYYHGNTA